MAIQQPGPKTGTDDKELKKYSLAWKLLRTNSVDPEFIIPLFNEFKESRPFILNPMYSTPTSLPLYFFFGYQLLQESDLMKRCGPVSNMCCCLNEFLIRLFIFVTLFNNLNTLYCSDILNAIRIGIPKKKKEIS